MEISNSEKLIFKEEFLHKDLLKILSMVLLMEIVFINVQKSPNRALIIFEDDGPGIPEDQYKNVFKPFFRLDKSRSLNQSGVGLDLL